MTLDYPLYALTNLNIEWFHINQTCTQNSKQFPLFVKGTTLFICMSAKWFLLLTKKTAMITVLCRHAHYDWQIAFLYVIGKSNMMLTWKYISGKHNFKHFNYIHVVEIPTQKGEHSWKCTKLSHKRKDGIQSPVHMKT